MVLLLDDNSWIGAHAWSEIGIFYLFKAFVYTNSSRKFELVRNVFWVTI